MDKTHPPTADGAAAKGTNVSLTAMSRATSQEQAQAERVGGATAPKGPKGPGSHERKYRILIVDDERSVLQVLQETLAAQGYEAVAFSSPGEALQKAKIQRFDALVLDLYMPEMSGMLFHAKLRVIDPELADHTVFISGYVSREELRAHMASTARFLEKPFKTQDLENLVRKALPARPRD